MPTSPAEGRSEMVVKRSGLGRGLEALLGPSAAASSGYGGATAPGTPRFAASEGLQTLAIDLLVRGAYQPRTTCTWALEDLAQSIRAQGVIQPIVVRPLLERDPGGAQRFEIVAGERRWRAAQMAGLQSVPVVIREIPDSSAIAMALIENIQREDLNPLEEAMAIRRLIDEFGLTHEDAADAIAAPGPRSRTCSG
jgi:ParB family chromosome partitioning protein